MRLEFEDEENALGPVTVTLSRRNLLTLLHKLEMAGSARTIWTDTQYCRALILKAETDDEHYGRRDFPAGIMHPQTETFIAGRERG